MNVAGIGKKTDNKSPASDTTSVSLISLLKQLSFNMQEVSGAINEDDSIDVNVVNTPTVNIDRANNVLTTSLIIPFDDLITYSLPDNTRSVTIRLPKSNSLLDCITIGFSSGTNDPYFKLYSGESFTLDDVNLTNFSIKILNLYITAGVTVTILVSYVS